MRKQQNKIPKKSAQYIFIFILIFTAVFAILSSINKEISLSPGTGNYAVGSFLAGILVTSFIITLLILLGIIYFINHAEN